MEIISRVSRGSNMDQIYLPRNRSGLVAGDYVIVSPLGKRKTTEKNYFYGIEHIEPIKLTLLESLFEYVDKNIESYDNIIITGSFLEKGFSFNDIDVLITSDKKIDEAMIKKGLEASVEIKLHIINMTNKELMIGLSTDPIYQAMLSKCISKRRLIYKIKNQIDYRRLDLHLLKSKTLINNFDSLDGDEKYYLTKNMIALMLFIKSKKISNERIDNEIENQFSLENVSQIKKNMLEKRSFLKKYEELYDNLFDGIMKGIAHGAKQK